MAHSSRTSPVPRQQIPQPLSITGVRMDVPNYREFGAISNPGFFNKWLGSGTLYAQFFLCSIGGEYFQGEFTADNLGTMAYFAWIGKIINSNPTSNILGREQAMVGALADLGAVFLPSEKIMPIAEARTAFILYVKTLVESSHLPTLTEATTATYLLCFSDESRAEAQVMAEHPNSWTFPFAEGLLAHLARSANRTFSLDGTWYVVHLLLSILKRGNISIEFIQKIEQGLRNETKFIVRVNSEVCKQFYNHFGNLVDDNNIERVVNRWKSLIPENAMRMKLTLEQASGSGLTSLQVCGRAIKMFPGFKWSSIARLFPTEWALLLAAFRAVGDSQWYGYKKDLDAVRRK